MAGAVLALLLPLLAAMAASAQDDAAAASARGCAGEAFSANRAYAACSDLPRLGASVHWTYDGAAGELSVAFVAAPAAPGGWVAWGLNPSGDGMAGAQALVAVPSSSSSSPGVWDVRTYNISGYALGEPGPIAFPALDLAAELGSDGRVRVFGRLSLAALGGAGVLNQVWQVGPAVTDGVPAPHAMAGDNLAAKAKLDLLTQTTTAVSSDDGGDSIAKKRNIHGVLNAVSWGILLPMGAIFARYLKTFRSADPAWFYLHVTCQLIGYGVGVSGWATGINLGNLSNGITYTLHRNIGITVFALATLQIFALFLRPKKEHKYRVYWNLYHHTVGYAVIILGITNIFKGMAILGVEQRWRTAYVAALCVLGFAAVILEAVAWGVVAKSRRAESKTFGDASNGHHLPRSV
ncbi:cytochrome b561 and DOMON domain-containing protein At3g25290-like [Oryza brachyantha]|uniref:cytochrome b561 and DOMON domain-containing protein At3g25290-like n=1 Tax=Oryza brachyantha TaxID=4533 RepID=UPI001ADA2D9E|nr:cytochrome b561 and DOMON domain-containing protein At3g25290-like [Oryza brachyantha]